MRKNKFLLAFISILLVAAFTLPLASCDFLDLGGGDGESESQSGDGGDEAVEDVVLFDKGTSYTIVYPANPNTELRAAALELRNAIQDITGETVNFVADNSTKYKESAKEICIGKTNREATSKAIEKFDGKIGYRYDMIDGRMVIIGNNDYLTTQAIKAVLAEIFTVKETKITVPSNLARFVDKSADMTALIVDDPKHAGEKMFLYKVIIPNGNAEFRKAATNFANEVESILNKDKDAKDKVVVSYKYDAYSAATDGQLEILVGQTNRAASSALYGELGYFSYKVTTRNGNILVGARLEANAVKGLNGLLTYIRSAYKSSIDGNCYIPASIELGDDLHGWTNEVPNLSGGTFDEKIYDSGDNTYLIRYTDVTQSEHGAYIETLTNRGFKKLATYDLGGNTYNLMQGEESTIYVIYNKASSEVRVSYDKKGYNYPTISKAGAEGSYTPTLWQLRVDNYGSRENGGMSYVLQLSNGHFVIIDGGYKTKEEADHLYKFLKMKAPTGETPVVEAWFISHLHGDHFGAFLAFTEHYLNKIELQGVYYNFLKSNVIPLGAVKPIQDAAKRWTGCKLYEKIRTGMTIKFTGLDVDVICTHEDLHPLIAYNNEGNDTTTVLKFTVTSGSSKQSIMFLGDCFPNECQRMMENLAPSGVLKSDIVQWSHHGYEGATKAVYQAIGAHTVLWPMNIVGWQYLENPSMVFNNWVELNRAGFCENYITSNNTVKNIIIAGYGEHTFCDSCDGRNSGGSCGAYQELVLPYTPKKLNGSTLTGQSMVNYYKDLATQYYNAHKNDRVAYTTAPD